MVLKPEQPPAIYEQSEDYEIDQINACKALWAAALKNGIEDYLAGKRSGIAFIECDRPYFDSFTDITSVLNLPADDIRRQVKLMAAEKKIKKLAKVERTAQQRLIIAFFNCIDRKDKERIE